MEPRKDLFFAGLSVLVGLTLRAAVSLHPYSGQGKPPMFGDFEAQRHWMEITVNLPRSRWYYNSTENDLMYWGLDYPPLTAYHSYLNGLVARELNPEYVELGESRGYESDAHKTFMRFTVLVGDVLVFIPGLVYFFYVTRVVCKKWGFQKSILMGLLYPGVILIDHGHFQYNSISLGFAIFAIAFVFNRKYVLCSIFFCLSLNYKQMSLYYAFPFFLYLLSECIPKPNQTIFSSVLNLSKISLTVILTFIVIWFPLVSNFNDLLQIVHRLFPIARGVFEDKVSNIWCLINIFYKLKNICPREMLRFCTLTTLVSILPSSIDLFLRPTVKKFIPSLINSSLAFFLFSFQVHEKTILLVSIPILLHLPETPIASFWFLVISVFSMFPLLIKDGLVTATFSLTIIYIVSFKLIYEQTYRTNFRSKIRIFLKDFLKTFDKKPSENLLNVYKKHKGFLNSFLLVLFVTISISLMVILCTISLVLKPPVKYPDLFPLMISVYSCIHFLGFFIYFNYVQLRIPQDFDEDYIKVKTS